METSASISRAAARSAWAVFALAVVPLAPLLAAGADVTWLQLGVLSWLIALAVKLPLMAALAVMAARAPAWMYGTLAGLCSAGAELGVVLLVLARTVAAPTTLDILLFASSAGSVEALGLLVWSWLIPTRPADIARWLPSAEESRLVRHQFVVERVVAWFGHLGSRSLLALAFVRQVPWLGAVAALTFAATDGVAAYEQQRHADWFAASTLKRYFRIAITLVGIELVVLAGFLLLTGAA